MFHVVLEGPHGMEVTAFIGAKLLELELLENVGSIARQKLLALTKAFLKFGKTVSLGRNGHCGKCSGHGGLHEHGENCARGLQRRG